MLYVRVLKPQATVSPPRGPQDKQPIVELLEPHRRLLSNELVSQASRLAAYVTEYACALLRAFPNPTAYILHLV